MINSRKNHIVSLYLDWQTRESPTQLIEGNVHKILLNSCCNLPEGRSGSLPTRSLSRRRATCRSVVPLKSQQMKIPIQSFTSDITESWNKELCSFAVRNKEASRTYEEISCSTRFRSDPKKPNICFQGFLTFALNDVSYCYFCIWNKKRTQTKSCIMESNRAFSLLICYQLHWVKHLKYFLSCRTDVESDDDRDAFIFGHIITLLRFVTVCYLARTEN